MKFVFRTKYTLAMNLWAAMAYAVVSLVVLDFRWLWYQHDLLYFLRAVLGLVYVIAVTVCVAGDYIEFIEKDGQEDDY